MLSVYSVKGGGFRSLILIHLTLHGPRTRRLEN